jgi:hypothetical protein
LWLDVELSKIAFTKGEMVLMFNFIPAAAQSFQIQTVMSVRPARRNHLSERLLKVRAASSGKVTLKNILI